MLDVSFSPSTYSFLSLYFIYLGFILANNQDDQDSYATSYNTTRKLSNSDQFYDPKTCSRDQFRNQFYK